MPMASTCSGTFPRLDRAFIHSLILRHQTRTRTQSRSLTTRTRPVVQSRSNVLGLSLRLTSPRKTAFSTTTTSTSLPATNGRLQQPHHRNSNKHLPSQQHQQSSVRQQRCGYSSVAAVLDTDAFGSIGPTRPSDAISNASAIASLNGYKDQPAPEVVLSTEQQFLLQQVVQKKKSIFFTGSAGTGKSVLLRHLIEELKEVYRPGQVAVTASTGIAACNIGGCTLHSFAGVGLGHGNVEQLLLKLETNKPARKRWRKTKVLIIDEVSMIDGELFDKLEQIARKLKKSEKPFGGIQLIVTGDFFQLPPVVADTVSKSSTTDEPVVISNKPTRVGAISRSTRTVIKNTSEAALLGLDSLGASFEEPPPFMDYPFATEVDTSSEVATAATEAPTSKQVTLCFDSESWKKSIHHTIQLTEVFRQRDPRFIKMLTEVRHGNLSEDTCEMFKQLERTPQYPDDGIQATELFALRYQVERANQLHLSALQGDSYFYEPRDSGPLAAYMDKFAPAPSKLHLKEDAQVMLIKNLSPTLVNGSLGIVMGFQEDTTMDSVTGRWVSSYFPVVRFVGEEDDLVIRPEEWRLENPDGEVVASRVQIPLILAWAMSIHKSQGQTMDRVKVDMGKIFEAGQGYVALSRATSLAGLQVVNFNKRSVQTNARVAEFYDQLATVNDLMVEVSASKVRGRKKKVKTVAATAVKVAEIEPVMPVAEPTASRGAKENSKIITDKSLPKAEELLMTATATPLAATASAVLKQTQILKAFPEASTLEIFAKPSPSRPTSSTSASTSSLAASTSSGTSSVQQPKFCNPWSETSLSSPALWSPAPRASSSTPSGAVRAVSSGEASSVPVSSSLGKTWKPWSSGTVAYHNVNLPSSQASSAPVPSTTAFLGKGVTVSSQTISFDSWSDPTSKTFASSPLPTPPPTLPTPATTSSSPVATVASSGSASPSTATTTPIKPRSCWTSDKAVKLPPPQEATTETTSSAVVATASLSSSASSRRAKYPPKVGHNRKSFRVITPAALQTPPKTFTPTTTVSAIPTPASTPTKAAASGPPLSAQGKQQHQHRLVSTDSVEPAECVTRFTPSSSLPSTAKVSSSLTTSVPGSVATSQGQPQILKTETVKPLEGVVKSAVASSPSSASVTSSPATASSKSKAVQRQSFQVVTSTTKPSLAVEIDKSPTIQVLSPTAVTPSLARSVAPFSFNQRPSFQLSSSNNNNSTGTTAGTAARSPFQQRVSTTETTSTRASSKSAFFEESLSLRSRSSNSRTIQNARRSPSPRTTNSSRPTFTPSSSSSKPTLTSKVNPTTTKFSVAAVVASAHASSFASRSSFVQSRVGATKATPKTVFVPSRSQGFTPRPTAPEFKCWSARTAASGSGPVSSTSRTGSASEPVTVAAPSTSQGQTFAPRANFSDISAAWSSMSSRGSLPSDVFGRPQVVTAFTKTSEPTTTVVKPRRPLQTPLKPTSTPVSSARSNAWIPRTRGF